MAQPRRRIARRSRGGRTFGGYLYLSGAATIVFSWRGGGPEAAIAGLVPFTLAAVLAAASRPVRLTDSPRRPLSEQVLAAAGWSWRRALLLGLSAFAIALSPSIGIEASYVFGSVVGVSTGLLCAAAGVGGLLASSNRAAQTWHGLRDERRARAERPEAVWTWDHPWDEHGARLSFRAYLGTRWMYVGRTALLVGLLLGPVRNDGSDASDIVTVLRIGCAIAGSVWLLRAWWVLGMGQVVLGYLRLPVHPGEHAEFTLGVSEGGAEIRDAEVVLRHYRESRDGTGPGSGLPLSTAVIAASAPASPSTFVSGVHRKVEFDIPADADVTSISSAHPSYWMLEVRGRTRAGPYEGRFLVPIYARPVAGGVAADPAASATPA